MRHFIAVSALLAAAFVAPARAQSTDCTSQIFGNNLYTTCQSQSPQPTSNLGQTAYDPNAFIRGAEQAQQFNQIRGRRLAGYDLARDRPDQAVKDLYEAGLIEDAQALEDRLAAKRSASDNSTRSAPSGNHPFVLNGVVYAPYKSN